MANHDVAKQYVIVTILLIIHRGWCDNGNCDMNHCKSLFPTIFKDFFKKGTQHLCRSSDETVKCVSKCLEIFFPDFDFLFNSKTLTSELCSYDIGNDLNRHWNCLSRHLNQLVTCMSIAGSMSPTNISSQALKKLSCKKFLAFLDCPYKILQSCDEEAMEIVSSLLSRIIRASMNSACRLISGNDVFDMPVKYSLDDGYLNTAACLDNLPDVTGSCFPQYLQTFDANDLYHCRNPCEKHEDVACLAPSLVKDFYIPVFSLGKYSCAETSKFEDSVQMQDTTQSTVLYNSDSTSEAYSEDLATNVEVDQEDYSVPSDEAKTRDVLSSDFSIAEASTPSYKFNTKKTDNKVPSIHSSDNFSTDISLTSTSKYPRIDSLPYDSGTVSATENNSVYRLEIYSQYLIVNFFVLVFLL